VKDRDMNEWMEIWLSPNTGKASSEEPFLIQNKEERRDIRAVKMRRKPNPSEKHRKRSSGKRNMECQTETRERGKKELHK